MSQINPTSMQSYGQPESSKPKTFLRSNTHQEIFKSGVSTNSPSTSMNTPCLSYDKNYQQVLNSLVYDPTSGVICTPPRSDEIVDIPQGSERCFPADSSPNEGGKWNEEEFSEFDQSLNESLYQKYNAATKKSHFDMTKQNFKTKSYSAHSIKPRANQTKGPAFDASNISIMDMIKAKGPLSKLRDIHKNDNPMKLKIKISSPLSINSKLCGEDTILYFEDAYGSCRLQEEHVLMNIPILEKVLEFLDFTDVLAMSKLLHCYRNTKEYKKFFSKHLSHHFMNGLDRKDQVLFWNSFVHFRQKKGEHPFAYSQNFARKCDYLSEIKKDVNRTLPEYDKYSTEEGKASLLRLLAAISNTIKDMGYMQGINAIGGIFLFYLKEEEAFWILLYFMQKLRFKDLFKEDFITVNKMVYQLELYLDHYIPDLALYLRQKEAPISYYATTWFLTLFSYTLNLTNTLKVWNFVFKKGRSFLIQFALAIFEKYKKDIMTMDIDELSPFLKSELKNLTEDDTSIFELALSFKVSKRLLKEADIQFICGKPQMQLVSDIDGKLQWIGGRNLTTRGSVEVPPDEGFGISPSNKDLLTSFLDRSTGETPKSFQNIFKGNEEKNQHQSNSPRSRTGEERTPFKREDSYKTKGHGAILPSQFIRDKRRRSRSLNKLGEELGGGGGSPNRCGQNLQSFLGNAVESPKQSIFKQEKNLLPQIAFSNNTEKSLLPLGFDTQAGDDDDGESTPKSTYHIEFGIPVHVKEALKAKGKSTPR